jgi:RNA polymerase sigma factor (sigma-70 family)
VLVNPCPKDPSDAPSDLLAQVDAHGWEELIRKADPESSLVLIRSAMGKKLREHSSPEDIWQETLAQAWRDRAKHEWRGEAAFRAWLFEIAKNRIRDAARGLATAKRGAGEAPARFSELGSSPSASISGFLPGDSQTPSRIVARSEKAEVLREALAALPPDLEAILRMHLLEEQTMEAIAAKLGIGVSAAWHRFRKGSEMLARILPGADASSAGP